MIKNSLFFVLVLISLQLNAQVQPYSQRMALTAMHLWPDSFSAVPGKPARWSYEQGVILKGIEGIWLATGDPQWFRYIQHCMDYWVGDDGRIKDYDPGSYNIDHLNNGKLLLTLFRVTGKEKYKKAALRLREQLRTHPRTQKGGFWHKKVYPYQMWLDGLYMGQPFYAEYAQVFGEDTIFNDVTRQFMLMEKKARDPATGLLYHGYDEARQERWAHKRTGVSPHFWARALGWYGMALVDALDYFPDQHPGKKELIAILNRLAAAVVKVQDAATGMWYDIADLPQRKPNYTESSATAMLAYTLAKGARRGYIARAYQANAKKAFDGLVRNKLTQSNGFTNLEGTVSVSGLGGKPYRDGSFGYYMQEKVVQNDPKGMGAFILAANEIEMIPNLAPGAGKTVLLDNYFNNEWKKGAGGQEERWHYTWNDRSNGGYSFLGGLFEQQGARLQSLPEAPAAGNLKNAAVYIIVDPDTDKETPHPHYMNEQDATQVADWVKKGGVLALLANDAGNCDLEHLNILAGRFGIRFNKDNLLMVKNNDYATGRVGIPRGNIIFKNAKNVYLKEISSLNLYKNVLPVLKSNDVAVMGVARYGKGAIFALGDPWIYNEYLDGRKLPLQYENVQAAKDWVNWLLRTAKTNQKK
ncbi:glycoside hydrolase family 88 protein [Niabella drilacis]|uniref:Unsaturated rhamnogalacturonyl hydrolase n=1 Tax=Niabella drilacis (strain DSM 25811 / CCM 8410 / CCUG 62505 / LMG 26954 / E90) TaxID=1285928 RepID=A0A1G6SAZ3_NIADE|nr:glycoside hydrolase family 88 protein [Niabella drilacis]SDD14072.1 unsaturated rhamnogalacturonyl hydrolase [Niabella drilacis]